MKKSKLKHIVSVSILIVMLVITIVPVANAAIYALRYSYEYNIPAGQDHWHGYNEGNTWSSISGASRYNVSILHAPVTVEVHGSLFRYRTLLSDVWITQVRFSGSNGEWAGSEFVADPTYTYYSRITEESKSGVNGRTSISVY